MQLKIIAEIGILAIVANSVFNLAHAGESVEIDITQFTPAYVQLSSQNRRADIFDFAVQQSELELSATRLCRNSGFDNFKSFQLKSKIFLGWNRDISSNHHHETRVEFQPWNFRNNGFHPKTAFLISSFGNLLVLGSTSIVAYHALSREAVYSAEGIQAVSIGLTGLIYAGFSLLPDFAVQFEKLTCVGDPDKIDFDLLNRAVEKCLISQLKPTEFDISKLKGNACSICLSDFQAGESVWLYSCESHVTHRQEDCNAKWRHCPYCGPNVNGSPARKVLKK